MSSTAEIAVDEDHRELHRVGRAAIRLFELRLAVSPDAADLLGQFGRKVHLLRDDRVPTSCLAKTLAKLRFHRRAIGAGRSEEHTSELQSLMRNSYAVFCLKKKQKIHHTNTDHQQN